MQRLTRAWRNTIDYYSVPLGYIRSVPVLVLPTVAGSIFLYFAIRFAIDSPHSENILVSLVAGGLAGILAAIILASCLGIFLFAVGFFANLFEHEPSLDPYEFTWRQPASLFLGLLVTLLWYLGITNVLELLPIIGSRFSDTSNYYLL